MKVISRSDVAKHSSAANCWVIIRGKVYDLTQFIMEHPGGSETILEYAGSDATDAFNQIHPPDIIERLLPPSVLLGAVEGADVIKKLDLAATTSAAIPLLSVKGERPQVHGKALEAGKLTPPPLSQILNLDEFEVFAKQSISKQAWAYYSSAADDEMTVQENRLAFQRIWFKPRVMINVKHVDCSTTILGYPTSMPVYITATALGRLAHVDGEVVLTKAAASQNIIQMIPTLASCSLEEILAVARPLSTNQTLFFQLYVNANREITQRLIEKAEKGGCRALFITVDAPMLAKREKDMRLKFTSAPSRVQQQTSNSMDRSKGAAKALSSFIDPSLCWDDLKWFRSVTSLPIVLKGIQTAEDAILAYDHGCQGIVLSNHGGRQLDYARSGIEVLPEVMDALRSIGADKKMEVYVDGGIRRGTDVAKALALGARAVGVGRPFLYAMGSYGQEGVEHAIQLLKDELETAMCLLGAPRLHQLSPRHLVLKDLASHSASSSMLNGKL